MQINVMDNEEWWEEFAEAVKQKQISSLKRGINK